MLVPNLLAAVGVLIVNPRNYIIENHSSLLNYFNNNNLIYTVMTVQCYFIFDYSVSVPGQLQT